MSKSNINPYQTPTSTFQTMGHEKWELWFPHQRLLTLVFFVVFSGGIYASFWCHKRIEGLFFGKEKRHYFHLTIAFGAFLVINWILFLLGFVFFSTVSYSVMSLFVFGSLVVTIIYAKLMLPIFYKLRNLIERESNSMIQLRLGKAVLLNVIYFQLKINEWQHRRKVTNSRQTIVDINALSIESILASEREQD